MEKKEWRRLAVQSVSLLIAVLVCSLCLSAQPKERIEPTVQAEAGGQAEESIQVPQATGQTDETEQEAQATAEPSEEAKIVVLDAGHGGIDEGTSSIDGKENEKEYTLSIAKQAAKLLEQEGVTVYLTRETDAYVTKKARTRLANRLEADLFISIHCNASSVGDTTAYGMEALYAKNENGNENLSNKKLASIMLNAMTEATGRRNRGVIERENLYLLHHAKVPATIVEIGYMSNEKDLNYMKKKGSKIAQGICDGILQALEACEG